MRVAVLGNGVSQFFAPFYDKLDAAARKARYPNAADRAQALAQGAIDSIITPLAQIANESASLDPRCDAYPLGHHAAALLAASGHYDSLLTTNYDSFIDRSLDLFCRQLGGTYVLNPAMKVSGRADMYQGFINEPPAGPYTPLWKVHGDTEYWRWLCCDRVVRAAVQPSFAVSLQEHRGCSAYRLGQPVYHVLLPYSEENDIAFLGLIHGALGVLEQVLESDGEIDVLGFRGREQEQLAIGMGELALRKAGTCRATVRYVNRTVDLTSPLPGMLSDARDAGLDVEFVEANADDWLLGVIDDLKLREVLDRHVAPDN